MLKPSKRYRQALEVADLSKHYSLGEAIDIVSKFPAVKFDETVELSFHLWVDPRQSDQMVRGTVALPHGSGKAVRVLVFTEDADAAREAGADHAGLEDMIEKVREGWLDFDVAIATTAAMREVRTVARVLGPKGLMPNPKSGTVTDDIATAIKAVKAGRVEFKMDKTANVAAVAGKRSFPAEQLRENAVAVLNALIKAKPESVKGRYIRAAALTTTMNPSVKLDVTQFPAQ